MKTTRRRKAEEPRGRPIACALWAFLLLAAPLPSLTLFAALRGCRGALSLCRALPVSDRRPVLAGCGLLLSGLMSLFSSRWSDPLVWTAGTAAVLWLAWPKGDCLVRVTLPPEEPTGEESRGNGPMGHEVALAR